MKYLIVSLLFLGLQGLTLSGKVVISEFMTRKYSCPLSEEPTYILTAYSECMDYYVCNSTRHRVHFICPDGTLFNTTLLSCDKNTRCELPKYYDDSAESFYSRPESSINHPVSGDYDTDRISTEFISTKSEEKVLPEVILNGSTPIDKTIANLSDTQQIYDNQETRPRASNVLLRVPIPLQKLSFERTEDRSNHSTVQGHQTEYETAQDGDVSIADSPHSSNETKELTITSTAQGHQTEYETTHDGEVFINNESKGPTIPSVDVHGREPALTEKTLENKAADYGSKHSTIQGRQIAYKKTGDVGEVSMLYSLHSTDETKLLTRPSEDLTKPAIPNNNSRNEHNLNTEKAFKSVKKRHDYESYTESSVTTHIWLDEFLVSVVRAMLNDDDVMVKVRNLIYTVFDIVTPLAEELVMLSNQGRYSSIIGVRREIVEHTLEELKKEAFPIFKDILIQKLPAILYNLSENVPGLLKFVDQTKYRIEANKVKIINKVLSLLKKYESIYETSTSEHFFIYSLIEIQEDIEDAYESFSEVFNDNLSRTSDLIRKHIGLWEVIDEAVKATVGTYL